MEQPSSRLRPPVEKPIPNNLELSEVYDVRKKEVMMGVLCRNADEFRNALILYGLRSTGKESLPSNPLEAISALHGEIMQKEQLYGDPLPKLQQFAASMVHVIEEENYGEVTVDRSLLGTGFTKTSVTGAKIDDKWFLHIEPTSWGGTQMMISL